MKGARVRSAMTVQFARVNMIPFALVVAVNGELSTMPAWLIPLASGSCGEANAAAAETREVDRVVAPANMILFAHGAVVSGAHFPIPASPTGQATV